MQRAEAPRRRRSVSRLVGEVLLTVAAIAGIAVSGVTVVAARSGLEPLVVRSGSMEPTIETGSMILVRKVKATEIEVGDIVSVQRPDRTRITHRVKAIEPHGETAALTLQGDANEDPDPVPVTVHEASRLVWEVPMAGRAVAWFATAQGGFVMGAASMLGFMATWRRSHVRTWLARRRASRHQDTPNVA